MKNYRYFLLSIFIIALDQGIKIGVHTWMEPGYFGQIPLIGDFFKLHYTLNPGMAFGIQIGSIWGKLILTTFRIFAMFGLGYYLHSLTLKNSPKGLLLSVALILGGAIGNLIDSVFYGVFLENAPYGAPMNWFHGQVIDMLFFPLFDGYYPDWIPGIGGNYFLFFSPVFNIADAGISVGIFMILLFYRKEFS